MITFACIFCSAWVAVALSLILRITTSTTPCIYLVVSLLSMKLGDILPSKVGNIFDDELNKNSTSVKIAQVQKEGFLQIMIWVNDARKK